MRQISILSLFKYLTLMCCAMVIVAGCSTLQNGKRSTPKAPVQTAATKAVKPVYYDFKDVLIPGELTLNQERSSVYQAGNTVGGVLTFDSRVELNSLVLFFENNMAKDGWQIIGKFKSKRSYLLFQKDTRNCVILISEDYFNTQVAVWVATAMSKSDSLSGSGSLGGSGSLSGGDIPKDEFKQTDIQ